MITLQIIRHAKSSWNFPVKDFDRPLNEIGIKRASKMGLKIKDLIPSEITIWSSPAIRASDTAKIIVKKWELNSNEIIYKKELYTFSSQELEKIIKSCNADVKYLLIFGHNNAITDFVNKFGDIFIENVPTAGFVSITFDENLWSKINKGTTTNIIFPRDLK